MSKAIDWIRASSVIAGTAIAAVNTVIQYGKFRREQDSLEYTRSLQRQAWEKVLNGQLHEAKVGDMQIKAPVEHAAALVVDAPATRSADDMLALDAEREPSSDRPQDPE